MEHLKLADISLSAIDACKKQLQECDRDVASLEERINSMQADLEALEGKRAELQKDLTWRQLMAEAEGVVDVAADGSESAKPQGERANLRKQVAEKLALAVGEFKKSLEEPADYEAECAADSSGDPVPYCDTDDYADLSAVDGIVEELIDGARETLAANAAPASASSTNSSIASWQGATVVAGEKPAKATDAPRAAARRRALLTLLVVSLYVGRLEDVCGFASIPDATYVPTADAEDVKETVAEAWQYTLHESHVLTSEERRKWQDIVADFLGAPFDGSAA